MKENRRPVGSEQGTARAVERADLTKPVPEALAEAMRALTRRAGDDPRLAPLEVLVHTAVAQVPGAASASITVRRGDRFRTAASTSDTAARADLLQYDLGSGPAMEVIGLADHLYSSNDVTVDPRWPLWGLRAHEEAGVTSALAVRLKVSDDPEAVAGLNVYSEIQDAFDDSSVSTALVLATHGSMFVIAVLASGRAKNLMRVLESNREVGVAMGILMQRHRLTREQALDMLRTASQDANRKLADVATEVADTGILPNRRLPRTSTSTANCPAGDGRSSMARRP